MVGPVSEAPDISVGSEFSGFAPLPEEVISLLDEDSTAEIKEDDVEEYDDADRLRVNVNSSVVNTTVVSI